MKKTLSLLVLSLWTILPMMAIHLNVGETETLSIGDVPYLKNAAWTISRPKDVIFTQSPQVYTTRVTVKAVNTFPATSPCIVQCTYYYYDLDPIKRTYTYLRSGFKSWTIFVGESGNDDDDNNDDNQHESTGPTGIKLPSSLEMTLNTKQTLTPTITPYGMTDDLKWSSSNPNVVTVWETGLVEALKEGEADITVRTSNGYSSICHVTVVYGKVEPDYIYTDPPYCNLKKGESTMIKCVYWPNNSYDTFNWYIENPDIIDFEENLNTSNSNRRRIQSRGKIFVAKKEGSTNLVITSINGLTTTCRITVWPNDYDIESLPALDVDLGLSVKWASNNVGAYYEDEYGNYYLWGYTDDSFEKGQEASLYNITQSDHDVAHVKWGSGWRIPTESEMKELMNKCTWVWTSKNNTYGYTIIGPNGNSIYLPCSGYISSAGNYVYNSEDWAQGWYWCSNRRTYISFTKSLKLTKTESKYSNMNTVRMPIRPVINYNETAIEDVTADAQSTIKDYFTIDGKKIQESQLTKGFYIIRYSNGKTKKLYIK